MGHSHKAERAESKRLLRQVSFEVIFISDGLKSAESLIYIAMAEEAAAGSTGNYKRAERNYKEALDELTELASLVSKAPSVYGSMIYTIQDRIQIAQTGVLELQLKGIAVAYSRSIDDKLK